MKCLKTVTLLAVLLWPSILAGEVFIDWKAGYYIEYPDDWYQVAYTTVDFFLASQNIDRRQFEYDAVLAQKSEKPFFEMPYAFLSYQPVGQLNSSQIDSVLRTISSEYGRKYVEGSLKSGVPKFNLSQPVYDKSLGAVVVKSRVTSEYTDKVLLEMWKFYEKGIAIFFCYAPKEMYNDARPIFLSILNSFSTRDVEKVASEDSVRVVDLSERELAPYDDSDFPEPGKKTGMSARAKRLIFILLLAVIAFGFVSVVVIKRKKK